MRTLLVLVHIWKPRRKRPRWTDDCTQMQLDLCFAIGCTISDLIVFDKSYSASRLATNSQFCHERRYLLAMESTCASLSALPSTSYHVCDIDCTKSVHGFRRNKDMSQVKHAAVAASVDCATCNCPESGKADGHMG